ncbi:MAG: hypothetical protein WA821_19680 [Anaerolineales bacterium]
MSSLILTLLALAFWVFTLLKLREALREYAQKKTTTALNICAIAFFGSLDLTFMIPEVAAFVDGHIFPNLSVLVASGSFLVGIYFLTVVSLTATSAPVGGRVIRLLRVLLGLVLSALLLIYLLFISKMPHLQFLAPRNLPDVIFKLIVWLFGITLSMILAGTILAHLPAKEFAVPRLRVLAIVLAAASAAANLLVSCIIALANYFWPAFSAPWLFTLATLFVICGSLAFLVALLGGKIYAEFVMFSSRLDYWRAFQDMQYLAGRMLRLFPSGAPPPALPSFWQFQRDPEYHLYHAMIIIMDGSAMAEGFLAELGGDLPEPEDWEIEQNNNLVGEAQEIWRALQPAPLPMDFYEVVEVYRRVSLALSRPALLTFDA